MGEAKGRTLRVTRPSRSPPTCAGLHVTVSRQLLKKLEAAQTGLGHAIPGATMEQVIEAALDLLLERQARARGQVKRPRKTVAANPTEAQAEAPSHQPAPAETQAEALSHQPAPPTPAPSSPQTSSPGHRSY
jgi:hypothetical protein